MKKWSVWFLLLTLLVLPWNFANAAFENGYPALGIEVSPVGPAQMQTVRVEVSGDATARPKVVWVQSDTDIWTATFDDGTRVDTGTHGRGTSAEPLRQRIDFTLDLSSYAPDSLEDVLGNKFLKSFIKDLSIDDMEWREEKSYEPVGAKPVFQKGSTNATIKVWTGYPLIVSNKYKYSTRYDGEDKLWPSITFL